MQEDCRDPNCEDHDCGRSSSMSGWLKILGSATTKSICEAIPAARPIAVSSSYLNPSTVPKSNQAPVGAAPIPVGGAAGSARVGGAGGVVEPAKSSSSNAASGVVSSALTGTANKDDVSAAMEILLSRISAEKQEGKSDTMSILAQKLGINDVSEILKDQMEGETPSNRSDTVSPTYENVMQQDVFPLGNDAMRQNQEIALLPENAPGKDPYQQPNQVDTAKVLTDVIEKANHVSEVPMVFMKQLLEQKNIAPLIDYLKRGKVGIDYVLLDAYFSEEGWGILCWLCHIGCLIEQDSMDDCGKVGCCETDDSPTPENFLHMVSELMIMLLEGRGSLVSSEGNTSEFPGANPMVGNYYDGSTPLMFAAEGGNVELFDLLLQAGADPMQKDGEYDTVIDVIESLERRGKFLEQCPKFRELLKARS